MERAVLHVRGTKALALAYGVRESGVAWPKESALAPPSADATTPELETAQNFWILFDVKQPRADRDRAAFWLGQRHALTVRAQNSAEAPFAIRNATQSEVAMLELPASDPYQTLAQFDRRDDGTAGNIDGVFVASTPGVTMGTESATPTGSFEPNAAVTAEVRVGAAEEIDQLAWIALTGRADLYGPIRGGGGAALVEILNRQVGLGIGLGYEQQDGELTSRDYKYRNLFADLRVVGVHHTYLATELRAQPNILSLVNGIRRTAGANVERVNATPLYFGLRTGAGPLAAAVGVRPMVGPDAPIMFVASVEATFSKAAFQP